MSTLTQVRAMAAALLLSLNAMACNLYDASKPDAVYLCANEKCTVDGGKSL